VADVKDPGVEKRAQLMRVSIYIVGRSPQHASSVVLILDHRTGLVSPQFQVKFDPSFHTVKNQLDSRWQVKVGFMGLKAQRQRIHNQWNQCFHQQHDEKSDGMPLQRKLWIQSDNAWSNKQMTKDQLVR
jgi:hypothetical protein